MNYYHNRIIKDWISIGNRQFTDYRAIVNDRVHENIIAKYGWSSRTSQLRLYWFEIPI